MTVADHHQQLRSPAVRERERLYVCVCGGLCCHQSVFDFHIAWVCYILAVFLVLCSQIVPVGLLWHCSAGVGWSQNFLFHEHSNLSLQAGVPLKGSPHWFLKQLCPVLRSLSAVPAGLHAKFSVAVYVWRVSSALDTARLQIKEKLNKFWIFKTSFCMQLGEIWIINCISLLCNWGLGHLHVNVTRKCFTIIFYIGFQWTGLIWIEHWIQCYDLFMENTFSPSA